MTEREPRPDPLDVEPDAVPETLTERDSWVCWRHKFDTDRGECPDYLRLKRDLEAELGLDLTVSQLKRHVDDHVRYSLTTGDLEVTT